MKEAALEAFEQLPKGHKKDYISKSIWNLIEKRNSARECEDHEREKQLNKDIKWCARAGREYNYIHQLSQPERS
eukprot:778848-Lingulodinium_polyedra.AAC.1